MLSNSGTLLAFFKAPSCTHSNFSSLSLHRGTVLVSLLSSFQSRSSIVLREPSKVKRDTSCLPSVSPFDALWADTAMANHHQPPPQPPPDDDFFEQFLSYGISGDASTAGSGGGGAPPPFPLALSLDQGAGEGSASGKRIRDEPNKEREAVHLTGLFPPGYGHVQAHQIRPNPPPQVFHAQPKQGGAPTPPQPPAPRPKVRARRGQATDPHSIAERLRRERIAERMRALQELVPNTNKTDRAAMLDEILDYVKFLKLQVKVLSMSRLGGAGAVAQLVADIPLSVAQGEASESGSGAQQQIWEKWSTDGTERHVAKLMEDDIGAAMQFLQSKALCMMPISLAVAIYDTQHHHHASEPHQPGVKPEPNTPS